MKKRVTKRAIGPIEDRPFAVFFDDRLPNERTGRSFP
jgi:hypothetical protein